MKTCLILALFVAFAAADIYDNCNENCFAKAPEGSDVDACKMGKVLLSSG